MKFLIIYAHPNTEGHNPLVLKEVTRILEKKGKDFEVIDLYKINYNPVLQSSEHYTSRNKEISEQNKKFQEKINQSTHLIFIYPVWWGTMPAILHGFFDRVLTPGFAYHFQGPVPIGHLKEKKAIVIHTSGASKLTTKLILGNRFKKMIKTHILNFCGIKTKVYHIDKATRLTLKQEIKR